MDYGPSDSSGTDDDLPPSHQNRVIRGNHISGNGRPTVVGTHSFPRIHNDMEVQIHRLEQEAYSAVLRAFKAQSDAITWEKESLMTELRKELRVSDVEHRELLGGVNADDIIRRIREWRKAGGQQTTFVNTSQPVQDAMPSPTVSASRKKQKTSQSMPSALAGAPSPALHQQSIAPSMQPMPSAAKVGAALETKSKKHKSGQTLPGVSSMKSTQYPSAGPTGRVQVTSRGSGALVANEHAETGTFDRYIGKKVLTKWPEDNNFYEAVITDYNPADGRHALVYDINTANETWEWVNLNEISHEDIRWVDADPGISRQTGRGGSGRGIKKSMGHGGTVPGVSRGRGGPKNQTKNEFLPLQNGIEKRSDEIEILHTDALIKEAEKVFGSGHPDSLEIEKAKKALKEHEQALVEAIARLADTSDGESEEGEHPFSHGQSMDRERGWRNRLYSSENPHAADYGGDTIGDGRHNGSYGDQSDEEV